MVKADLVAAVEAKIIEMHGGEHTVERSSAVPPVAPASSTPTI
jgi:hypothetical protein